MTLSRILPFAQFASLFSPFPRMSRVVTNRSRGGRWIVLAAILLATVGMAQRSAAQATIHVNTTAQGATYGQCSLQEAIYSAELGASIAIDDEVA